MDNFEIVIGKYKAAVKVIYNSTQITRFKISLKEKYFILENVPFIAKHDNEETWNFMQDKLAQLGYKVCQSFIHS